MALVSVAVVMPAFNESAGIAEFLEEIRREMVAFEVRFVVVDDCSTDGTSDVVRSWAASSRGVVLVENSTNAGHGVSTLTALQRGLESGVDVIVAVDGDGQFFGRDIARLVIELNQTGADVVEGVRVRRGEPLFRRATSAATRVLVRSRCGVGPLDANTPLRAYRSEVLRQLLDVLPPNTLTPNLFISAVARTWRLRVLEFHVESRERRGPDASGSTWAARRRSLPSRRFVAFCRDATIQWVRTDAVGRSRHDAARAGAPDAPSILTSPHLGLHTTAAADA